MRLLRNDTFIKDIVLLLLVSIVISALFAAGFALATNKYFGQAITGIIGDMGQYDLLFQTRIELKDAMARQLRQVIAERFPGATLKPGISVIGKATFFLTLPSQYKTKTIFENLGSYFNNLPGNGDCSIMTEPRINVSSIPGGIFDLLAQDIDRIPGVKFTYHDGSSIGVIMDDSRVVRSVNRKIKQLLEKYQILEVRLNASYSREELMGLGKRVSQGLLGIKGVDYARDITMDGGRDDSQYLMNTLLQVKRFLTAYAAEVKINPVTGQDLEMGDLLVANGQNVKDLKIGATLEPLEVVIKITAKDAAGLKGLIIQGDASFLRDNNAYKLLPGDKIGRPAGTIEVSNRKGQLVYAMDQGVKLLTQVNAAIKDFNNTTGGAGITASGVAQAYQRLATVRGALSSLQGGISGLTGKANKESLTRAVNLIDGVAGDLDYLAKTFGRVQILENRFNQALDGLNTAKFLFGSAGMEAQNGIGDKMQLLNSQLGVVENSLRDRVQKLDDFINRFNPLVATLLTWRNKAKDFANQIDNFGAVFTPGSANHRQLTGLLKSTDQILGNLTGFDLFEVKNGLNIVSDHLFGSDKIDLAALIAELEKARDSLPQLLDEEIGHSINLIDKYAGGTDLGGQKVQVFTTARMDRETAQRVVHHILDGGAANIFSVPVGTIQPDIRGELFKILGEVRSTIAALIVIILWVLTFILDQSLIVSMLKMMELTLLPKRSDWGIPWLNWIYHKVYCRFSRLFSLATLYAASVGGILLGLTFALSGAQIPYLNNWLIGLIGAMLGIFLAMLSEKINPICKEEVMAGLSLGLPFRTIMREIVIPAGRPGMLQFLNRWKMVVK